MTFRTNKQVKRRIGSIDLEDAAPTIEALKQSHAEYEESLVKIGQLPATPSTFTEFAIYMPHAGKLKPFSFEGRRYLKTIYDSNAKRILLLAGRQTEKTVLTSSLVSCGDGSLIKAGDVQVGDQLATLDTDHGFRTTTGGVSWVSRRYLKPCVRIRTRQRHECNVALTHPMRIWGGWREAGYLKVGDRLAVARRLGEFSGITDWVSDERVRLTAYLIGDGYLSNYISFTSVPGKKLDEFLADLQTIGCTAHINRKSGTTAQAVRLHKGRVYDWMEEDGLSGSRSATKFLPSWVFGLSKRKTALFLNRLWATDGHIKQRNPTLYSIEYCSISPRLIREVQALLWKFGVPSRIRENWPSIYKRRGEKKIAYILRVETQDGVRRFLTEIGALGKSGGIALPKGKSNNNHDTYPKEINGLIRKILASRGNDDWFENRRHQSLYRNSLRRTLRYAPTKEKLVEYIEFFRSDHRFDQKLVDLLAAALTSDVYWDTIIEITPLGEQECIDFEVSPYHNFIADGFVTHNSTMLGNKSLAYMSLNPYFRVLYVSSSFQQTKVFSKDRIKEPIDISPIVSTFTNKTLLANILEKKLINGSQITLRFAFLNADRCRGIAADSIYIDEVQDVLLDNIPVIEECASHSNWRLFTYSGTPKSLDNALEHYWTRFSTQNEWAVPCRHHGTPGKKHTWHWNILDEVNIGDDFLICEKCGKRIDPQDPDADWVSMNPKPKVKDPFEGYRIPQLMVPWIKISDIKDKQKRYSRTKFHNEVMGRSYDSGTRPLTRGDLIRNSWDELSMDHYRQIIQWSAQYPIFLGADWGSGENSYTVVALGGYLPFAPDHFTFFYLKRFEGVESEPKGQLALIKKLTNDFNVRYLGLDYGGGHWPNDELTREFGAEKVRKYQWVGNVKQKIKYEPRLGVPRFLCHRTEIMSDMFNAIKRGNVFRFPRWEEFEDLGRDFINIFSEYNDRLRMNVYKHAPGQPDDAFHACCFAFLASFYYRPRPDVILPSKEINRPDNVGDLDDILDENINDIT